MFASSFSYGQTELPNLSLTSQPRAHHVRQSGGASRGMTTVCSFYPFLLKFNNKIIKLDFQRTNKCFFMKQEGLGPLLDIIK